MAVSIPGYWAEVWDNPRVGSTKRVGDLGLIGATLRSRFSDVGEGEAAIAASNPRLPDILDPEILEQDALIKVFSDELGPTIPEFEFFVDETDDPIGEPGTQQVTIRGVDLNGAANDGILYPRDHPVQPSVQPDWSYGGSDELIGDNAGFELLGVANNGFELGELGDWSSWGGAAVEVVNDPGNAFEGDHYAKVTPSGIHQGIRRTYKVLPSTTYTVTARMQEPTGGGARHTLGVSLGAGGVAVSGHYFQGVVLGEIDGSFYGGGCPTGGGADGTWQNPTVTITTGPSQTTMTVYAQYDHHSFCSANTPREFWVDDIQITGGTIGLEPWKLKGSPTVTIQSGTVRTGSYAAQIVANATGDGIQLPIPVNGGERFTFEIWAESPVAGEQYTASIISKGAAIAQDIHTIAAANTMERYVVTGNVPTDATMITIRFFYSDTNAPQTVFVDDAAVFAGDPPGSPGTIVLDMLAPIQARGALTWVTTDFTGLLDSNGDPWTVDDLEIRFVADQSLYQVLTKLARFGFEWAIENVAGVYTLRLWNPGGRGQDKTGTVAIHPGTPTGGNTKRRSPGKSVALARGENGQWAEVVDASRVAAFGRKETAARERAGEATGTLTGRAQAELDKFSPAARGIKYRIPHTATFVPRVDFGMGDLIKVNDPDDFGIAEVDVRIRQITTFLRQASASFSDIAVNSVVYEKQEATAEHVLRILRKVDELGELATSFGGGGSALGAVFGDVEGDLLGPLEVVGIRTYPITGDTPTAGVAPFFDNEHKLWRWGNPLPFVIVSAAGAPSWLQNAAQYRCDGLDDEEEINAALLYLDANFGVGRVVLSGGFYNLSESGTPMIEVFTNLILEGMGQWSTVINYSDLALPILRMGQNSTARGFAMRVNVD